MLREMSGLRIGPAAVILAVSVIAAVAPQGAHAKKQLKIEYIVDPETGDSYSFGPPLCHYLVPSGKQALKRKDYGKAVERFTKAIGWTEKNCKPEDWKIGGLTDHYRDRAFAYRELRKPDLAGADIALANEKMKGEIFVFLEREDWIPSTLDDAVKAKPNDPSLRGVRADYYDRCSAYAERCKSAPSKDAMFAARMEDRSAQIELARTEAEKAAALAARSKLYRYGEKKPELALEDISAAIGLAPSPAYYESRAGLRATLDQPAEAIVDDLTVALEGLSPDDFAYPRVLEARIEQLEKLGKTEAAAKDYAALVKKSPKNKTYWRGYLLVLTELGDDQAAARARRLIGRLDPGLLTSPGFLCDLSKRIGQKDGRTGEADTASMENLRRAWGLGETVAVVPVLHLIGKSNPKADSAWQAISAYVQAAAKKAGRRAKGLEPIPNFEGPKPRQAQQAISVFFKARKPVSAALTETMGARAAAVFELSSAGYLAQSLNRIGIPNLNGQLEIMLQQAASPSGLPCDAWTQTAAAMASRAKPPEVVKAWDADAKQAKIALTDRDKTPSKEEKKSETVPQQRKSNSSQASPPAKSANSKSANSKSANSKSADSKSANSKTLSECDEADEALSYGLDINTMPPC